jgi:ATP-dependent Clp protease ATP-binding subunit ClpB
LRNAGVTPQALEKAVNDIRKGRKVTSSNAESSFDAVKKYARDVTARARAEGRRRHPAGTGEGRQRHPQGPQGHQQQRRSQLRRIEEVRP